MAKQVDAKKETHGRDEAIEVLGRVSKVIAAKGKKVVSFDLKKTDAESEELLKEVLGPTGNLRAPTLLRGKTMLVGYNEEAYSDTLL